MLLVSGRVSVPKPLSQIQRSTRWLLQWLSPRTSFGGFGLSVRARQKNIRVKANIDPDVPDALVGDPKRLLQVIVNLVGNALKFTQQGEVVLRAELEEKTEEEAQILFVLSDTGIGIAPEHRQLIFGAFTQADSTTTRKFGGTGLGLAISSELIGLMNGRIWVESELDKGSTFYFTVRFGVHTGAMPLPTTSAVSGSLPQIGNNGHVKEAHVNGSVQNYPEKVPTAEDRDQRLESLTKLHVLLAEDNVVNQRLAQRLLEKAGHSVTVAANGKEAIDAFESGPFDVILMDVQMPEMDGFEATAIVRKKEQGSNKYTPVIAMTAHAMMGDRERCLDAGMDEYLSKPLKAGKLLKVIESSVKEAANGKRNRSIEPDEVPDESPYDRDAALARVEGDEELLDEIVGLFLDDCPNMIKQIKVSVKSGDSQSLQRSAHTLKGAVGNLGAKNAQQLSLKLEMMGKDGDISKADVVYAELEKEMDRLEEALSVPAEELAA